jgi:hypothetical protein
MLRKIFFFFAIYKLENDDTITQENREVLFNILIDHFDLRQHVLNLHILHVCIYVVAKREREKMSCFNGMKNRILHA